MLSLALSTESQSLSLIVLEMKAESFKRADSAETNELEGPVKQRTRKSNADQRGDTARESNIKCGGEIE